ncbi:DUF72 domain-containing protein [Lysobacter sp. A6]|uniref:DUF72 domain-containing protein n=1 Tax=Noviluteimonas lactosilytica TaxID=2888523 RepID=A0ABS8JF64_9GAMM|nr:DUF72 domain-containing protein [Lysobacter lactosilyticus]MCC8362228.1 DUF72 domain-containing protein [Lysobacter lactosilyticus]
MATKRATKTAATSAPKRAASKDAVSKRAASKDADLGLVAPGPVDGIRVGVGGWTYAPWRETFYPDGLVQRRELEYASRRLSAIEINGTYYSAQKPDTYARWRDETPDGFVFTAKAPMRIVQAKVLANTLGQVEAFVGGLSTLGDKLGAILWQFERKLDGDDFATFVEGLPATANGVRLRHALEVRDANKVDATLIDLARRKNAALVYTDSPEWPSLADVTADFVYARLMQAKSKETTGYPRAALKQWAARARTWSRGEEPDDLPKLCGPTAVAQHRDVFVFFINADKERNPAAAMTMIELLKGASK